MSLNIAVDWKAECGNKVIVPVSIGVGRIFNFSKLLVRISEEVQYATLHLG